VHFAGGRDASGEPEHGLDAPHAPERHLARLRRRADRRGTESYEIDVMNGSTVVRTLTATTNSKQYTAAQQTTDFGSPQASITLNLYQISARVGRGYARSATL
jgi:hypothetical protein